MTAAFLALRPVASEAGGLFAQSTAAPQKAEVHGFAMSCQEEDFWCWAAVTQAVENWRNRAFSQSEIASDHVAPNGGLVCATPLGPDDGGQNCGKCDGGGCNDPHYLSTVLQERRRLAPNGATNAPPRFSDVRRAIDDDQRPLPVRIDWGTGGHFVCVSGYSIDATGERWVTVYDPLDPGRGMGAASELTMRFDDFLADYQAQSGSGGKPNYHYEVQ